MRRSIQIETSVAAALLLAASTTLTAAGGDATWHRDGPGGFQVRDDFAVDEVFRDRQVYDYAFAPEPGGRSFLALQRQFSGKGRDVDASLVRFTLDDQGRLSRSVVLGFGDLRDPALWDAGVDLEGVDLPGGGLSVAPGGDAFLSLGASRDGTFVSQTLLRVAPDGSVQKVLAAGDLSAAGTFPDGALYPHVNVAASGDDRLWGHAAAYVPSAQGDVVRLIQIVDPTSDGDWSDRVVQPLVLPASLPQMQDGVWDLLYGDFVNEAPVLGSEGAGSVLLPVIGRAGDYRVYRLTDTEGDGILDADGEAELVFEQSTDPGSLWMFQPTLASASPTGDDSGLAFLHLTDQSRVSVIADGVAQDIVRGLYNPSGILVHPDGSLYVGVQGEGASPKRQPFSILRVTPAESPSAGAGEPAAPLAGLAPPGGDVVPRGSLTPGVPLLKTWLFGTDWEEMLLFYGADGSGPVDVLPGIQTRSSGCPALGGSEIVVDAEIDVPNEESLYLADTTGAQAPRLLSESSLMVLCPFGEDAIAVVDFDAMPWSVSRMDLRTGATALLDAAIPPGLTPSQSPDGRLLAMASGDDGTTLRLADLRDGSVRVLAEDLPATAVGMRWSPDAGRLAYATTAYDPMRSQQPGPHDVWVVDVEGDGPPERVFTLQASPDLAWSPDGRQLAIRANSQSDACCDPQGELTILDLQSRATRVLAPDASFVAWSPVDPSVLAWGSPTRLVIEEGGVPREIKAPRVRTRDGRTPLHWTGFTGWSPDGRYLGFGYPRLVTVDAKTGRTRVILDGRGEAHTPVDATWWP